MKALGMFAIGLTAGLFMLAIAACSTLDRAAYAMSVAPTPPPQPNKPKTPKLARSSKPARPPCPTANSSRPQWLPSARCTSVTGTHQATRQRKPSSPGTPQVKPNEQH